MTTQLELTIIEPITLLDIDTFDAYSSGAFKNDSLKINRELFKGKEIKIGEIYFSINEIDGVEFLHPYRVSVGKTFYRYAFVGYDAIKKELFWFFQGVSKTKERDKAFQIYHALVQYCEDKAPNIQPLIIKR